MNEEQYEDRKNKLYTYLESLGIKIEEVDKYMKDEYEVSKSLGMSEIDSKSRSLTSTFNYYRKYIDKIGNRIKFMCLGYSAPTDFGLSKKVKEIKKRWQESNESERDYMIREGIVDQRGSPLHTNDTTIFEERKGKIIILDDEMSQQLIGVIEDTETNIIYPALVKIYGKKGCEEQKSMYIWTMISGEQTKSTLYPDYIVLNSRELLSNVCKGSKRINKKEYEEIINNVYKDRFLDAEDADLHNKLLELKGHAFIKNSVMLSLSFSPYGSETSIVSSNSRWEAKNKIIADVRMSGSFILDADINNDNDEIFLCVVPKGKKQNSDRILLDVLGVFTENPIDLNKYKMDQDFIKEENVVTQQIPTLKSNEGMSFLLELEKRNGPKINL